MEEPHVVVSKMQLTTRLGADFWNDSCDPRELAEAVEAGAVGATSNPVIVHQVLQAARDTWLPFLDSLIEQHPTGTEEEIAWRLVEAMAAEAAAILAPVHERTDGRKGYVCVQVNPQYYRDSRRMATHGRRLAAAAPNVAVKIPATQPGLAAMEALTAEGIRINATVCFTVAQAVASAEAIERGLRRAAERGLDVERMRPVVTIMVGRLDDHLRRAYEGDGITIDPGFLNWAGIAVFKKAHAVFRSRPYRATLLAAAYRHHLHWSELVGNDVVLSMPYKWWKQFDVCDISPLRSLERPVAAHIVDALYFHFADFRRAYDEDALAPEDFTGFGASVHTLLQFLAGYQQLLDVVRGRMLKIGRP